MRSLHALPSVSRVASGSRIALRARPRLFGVFLDFAAEVFTDLDMRFSIVIPQVRMRLLLSSPSHLEVRHMTTGQSGSLDQTRTRIGLPHRHKFIVA